MCIRDRYTGARGKSGCNDANAEYIAYLRKVMDDAGVFFQTSELGKVDQRCVSETGITHTLITRSL